MDLIKWNKVYEKNKELDAIFYQKYQDDKDLYQKNVIELLVELGEFVNETRIFKYWSVKRALKKKMLEEYADVITMCLYFFNEFDLELDNLYSHINGNKLEVINYLFQQSSLLFENKNSDIIKDIFYNVIYLGKLFGFYEDEIIKAINTKHNIINDRLNSNY